jgi:surfeit locus 1 family protein
MKRIIPTLAALALITLTFSLGMWQMRRADYKTQLAQARDVASQTVPEDLLKILGVDGSIMLDTEAQKKRAEALPYGIRARLTGRWLTEHSVFIDNRTLKGIAGFHVVTPFALAESSLVVAVNRGWVARNIRDRNLLPAVPSTQEVISFEAWIEKPQKAMELGGDQPSSSKVIASPAGNSDNTALWQNFDTRRLEERAKVRLAPWLLRQSNQAAFKDGLNRDWPAPANDVAKHQGYAFQWFGLAGLTAVLWLWFVMIKPRRSAAKDHAF